MIDSDISTKEDQNRRLRGYELIVVDAAYLSGKNPTPICHGSELTGVTFVLSEKFEPVTIQQIAVTQVTPDPNQLNAKEIACNTFKDFRLAYYISEYRKQSSAIDQKLGIKLDHSLCSNHLTKGRNRDGTIPALQPQQSTNLTDIFEILPDQLSEYAVIIPEAEYDEYGISHDLTSQYKPLNLPPAQTQHRKFSVEWFELACASGALAHTDLSGLVDIGEPPRIRTAALRMFRAQYHGEHSHTLNGIPFYFKRNIPLPSCIAQQDKKSSLLGLAADLPRGSVLEAYWGKPCEGDKFCNNADEESSALCLDHSRLWMKDFIISETRHYSKPQQCRISPVMHQDDLISSCLIGSEKEFIDQFQLGRCAADASRIFTSYAIHHIVPTHRH